MAELSFRIPVVTAMKMVLEAHRAVELTIVQEGQQNESSFEYIDAPFRKLYTRFPTVQLPKSSLSENLYEVLKKRKSIRRFDENYSMDIETLGKILGQAIATQGKEEKPFSRSYPSAGARY